MTDGIEFFAIQFFVGFVSVGLRILQTYNVVRVKYVQAFLTSTAMGVANVALIGFVASDPWSSWLPVSLGSTAGVMFVMWAKNRKGEHKDASES